MMKVLVLGATGFIGGQIARAAVEAGWEVSGLRRDATRTGDLGGLPVDWIRGDLMDFDSIKRAMTGIDVVFHAAAFYPKEGHPSKVPEQIAYANREIENMIEAARQTGLGRLIYTSSLTTIGHPPPHENRLADESDIYIPGSLPKSGYYESKIAMEQRILTACQHGLPAVILNPTAVFGPGDVHLTMGGLLVAVARGWMVGWLPGEINVVDVREVAAAHLAAVTHGRVGERYIIGGHNFTVREALTIAARVAGVNSPRFEIPLWLLKGLIVLGDIFPSLPLPSNHLRAVHLWQSYNTDKAARAFGIVARPFAETVQDALAWFRENEQAYPIRPVI